MAIKLLTPRRVNLRPPFRRNSSAQTTDGVVHTNEKVSVVPNEAQQGEARFYMHAALSAPSHIGAESGYDDDGLVITQIRSSSLLNRWNSKTKTRNAFEYSTGPQVHSSKRQSPQRHGLPRKSAQDIEAIKSDRQSMKDLADFLRTKEPSKENFMSIPESDYEQDLQQTEQKSPFKQLFKRRRRTEISIGKKGPKLLQLPDTAVASKTSAGNRHIAISIPIEYDYVSSRNAPYAPKRTLSKRLEKREIAILRPVTESDETNSDGPITIRYSYAHSHHSLPATGTNSKASRLEKDFVSQPPLDLSQQNNQWSNLCHSGGTVYSEQTLATSAGHSRAPRNISTAQTTPLGSFPTTKTALPPQLSSAGTSQKKSHADSTARHSIGHERNTSTLSEKSAINSRYSTNSSNFPIDQSLPHPPLPENSQKHNQTHIGTFVRPTSAPVERSVNTSLRNQDRDCEIEGVNTIEIRQEKVKARKKRDMAAAAQRQKASRQPLTENNALYLRRKHSRSGGSLRRQRSRRNNRLTPVLIVADIAPNNARRPPYSRHPTSQLESERQLRHTRALDTRRASQVTDTPPQSGTPSLVDGDFSTDDAIDDDYFSVEMSPFSPTPSLISKPPPSSQFLNRSSYPLAQPSQLGHSARPRSSCSQRRVVAGVEKLTSLNHNKIAHEREMALDSRLAKIERDNALLLCTLSNISENFNNLNSNLMSQEAKSPCLSRSDTGRKQKEKGKEIKFDDDDDNGKETEQKDGLDGIGNLMQELQISARVSMETRREKGVRSELAGEIAGVDESDEIEYEMDGLEY